MHYTEYVAPTAGTSVPAETDLYDGSTPAPVVLTAEGEEMPEWMRMLVASLGELDRGTGTAAARLGRVLEFCCRIESLYRGSVPARYVRDAPSSAQSQRADFVAQWFAGIYSNLGRILAHDILPGLARRGLRLRNVARLHAGHLQWARNYFLGQIYPLLIPLAVDPGRPFPRITGGNTNLLVALQTPEQAARRSTTLLYACVEVPPSCSHLIQVPPIMTSVKSGSGTAAYHAGPLDGARLKGRTHAYMWTSDLVRYFLHELFPGMVMRDVYLFRVLRDPAWTPEAELNERGSWGETGRRRVGEFHARGIRRQHEAPVIRLELESDMPCDVATWLAGHLQAAPHTLVRVPQAAALFGLADLLQKAEAIKSKQLSTAGAAIENAVRGGARQSAMSPASMQGAL